MQTAPEVFFSSPRFAVAGASQDHSKFGYKGPSSFDAVKLFVNEHEREQCWPGTMHVLCPFSP